MFKEGVGNIFF